MCPTTGFSPSPQFVVTKKCIGAYLNNGLTNNIGILRDALWYYEAILKKYKMFPTVIFKMAVVKLHLKRIFFAIL